MDIDIQVRSGLLFQLSYWHSQESKPLVLVSSSSHPPMKLHAQSSCVILLNTMLGGDKLILPGEYILKGSRKGQGVHFKCL